jgi:3-mercaptopyruvate sulfurtransferase SseA
MTSARVALQLRKAGIRHVRPLEGGLDAWRALGYPTEPVSAQDLASVESMKEA